jgi:hypothetical protein
MILSNQAKCTICGESIYSKNRHDYVRCSCGNLAVDGGMCYLKRGHKQKNTIIEQSIIIDDDLGNSLLKSIKESIESDRNELGILCGLFRCLRDSGYNVIETTKGDEDGS